jgi:hypothetical protein
VALDVLRPLVVRMAVRSAFDVWGHGIFKQIFGVLQTHAGLVAGHEAVPFLRRELAIDNVAPSSGPAKPPQLSNMR